MHTAVSLLSALADVPIVIFDVETTGASAAYGDRITEIGLVRIENGQVVDRYGQLVNPCRRIAPGVVALTGITPGMVADQPTFEAVAPTVVEKMRGAIVVGHNVRFDLSFLKSELARAQIRLEEAVDLPKVLDTVRLARRLYGRGGNGLQRLASRLGVVVEVAHRALADCLTTAAVLERMIEPLGGWQMSVVDAITLQGGVFKFADAPRQAPDLPVELEEALAAKRHVRMIYLDARNNRTERIIIPIQLNRPCEDRSLTAFCTLRQERRSFKLSRIVELTRIETLYDQPACEGSPSASLSASLAASLSPPASLSLESTAQEKSPEGFPSTDERPHPPEAPGRQVDLDAPADRAPRVDPGYVSEPQAGA